MYESGSDLDIEEVVRTAPVVQIIRAGSNNRDNLLAVSSPTSASASASALASRVVLSSGGGAASEEEAADEAEEGAEAQEEEDAQDDPNKTNDIAGNVAAFSSFKGSNSTEDNGRQHTRRSRAVMSRERRKKTAGKNVQLTGDEIATAASAGGGGLTPKSQSRQSKSKSKSKRMSSRRGHRLTLDPDGGKNDSAATVGGGSDGTGTGSAPGFFDNVSSNAMTGTLFVTSPLQLNSNSKRSISSRDTQDLPKSSPTMHKRSSGGGGGKQFFPEGAALSIEDEINAAANALRPQVASPSSGTAAASSKAPTDETTPAVVKVAPSLRKLRHKSKSHRYTITSRDFSAEGGFLEALRRESIAQTSDADSLAGIQTAASPKASKHAQIDMSVIDEGPDGEDSNSSEVVGSTGGGGGGGGEASGMSGVNRKQKSASVVKFSLPASDENGKNVDGGRNDSAGQSRPRSMIQADSHRYIVRDGVQQEMEAVRGIGATSTVIAEDFGIGNQDFNATMIHPKHLVFAQYPQLETAFQRHYVQQYGGVIRRGIFYGLLLWSFLFIWDIVTWKADPNNRVNIEATIASRAVIGFIGFAYYAMFNHPLCIKHMQPIVGALLVLYGGGQLLLGAFENNVLDPTYSVAPILIASIASSFFRLRFRVSTTVGICLVVIFACFASPTDFRSKSGGTQEVVVGTVASAIAIVIYARQSFTREFWVRHGFLAGLQLAKEENKSKRVLQLMLPEQVIDQMHSGSNFVFQRHDCVSVLLSNICSFDRLTMSLRAIDLVGTLNNLFSFWDALTDEFGAYKVETIGDVYMVSCGILRERPDHAAVLCMMSLDMHASMEFFQLDGYEEIFIRTGVNSGPVIAGVIGMRYPRYRLMGDTVNVASRMSTTCSAGQTQVSQATHDLIREPGFRFQARGPVPIKGKGMMRTYCLLGHAEHGHVLSASLESTLTASPSAQLSGSEVNTNSPRKPSAISRFVTSAIVKQSELQYDMEPSVSDGINDGSWDDSQHHPLGVPSLAVGGYESGATGASGAEDKLMDMEDYGRPVQHVHGRHPHRGSISGLMSMRRGSTHITQQRPSISLAVRSMARPSAATTAATRAGGGGGGGTGSSHRSNKRRSVPNIKSLGSSQRSFVKSVNERMTRLADNRRHDILDMWVERRTQDRHNMGLKELGVEEHVLEVAGRSGRIVDDAVSEVTGSALQSRRSSFANPSGGRGGDGGAAGGSSRSGDQRPGGSGNSSQFSSRRHSRRNSLRELVSLGFQERLREASLAFSGASGSNMHSARSQDGVGGVGGGRRGSAAVSPTGFSRDGGGGGGGGIGDNVTGERRDHIALRISEYRPAGAAGAAGAAAAVGTVGGGGGGGNGYMHSSNLSSSPNNSLASDENRPQLRRVLTAGNAPVERLFMLPPVEDIFKPRRAHGSISSNQESRMSGVTSFMGSRLGSTTTHQYHPSSSASSFAGGNSSIPVTNAHSAMSRLASTVDGAPQPAAEGFQEEPCSCLCWNRLLMILYIWFFDLRMRFFLDVLEDVFQADYARRFIFSNRSGLLLASLTTFACQLTYHLLHLDDPTLSHLVAGICATVCLVLLVALQYVANSPSKAEWYYERMQKLSAAVMLINGWSLALTSVLFDEHARFFGIAVLIIFMSVCSSFVGMRFRYVMVVNFGGVLFWFVSSAIKNGNPQLVVFFLITSSMFYVHSAHRSERYVREHFVQLIRVNTSERRTRAFLDNMLPAEVADEIRTSNRLIAHFRQHASVLISDIVSFTKLAGSVPPEDLVAIINVIFSTFDRISTRYGVYKVETVGDAYIACTGVVSVRQGHFVDLVDCALSMQRATRYFYSTNHERIIIRIGIHTGPVVAGVVGRKMPRYHLFGETVSIAHEMESKGVQGGVVISGETYDKVSQYFDCAALSNLSVMAVATSAQGEDDDDGNNNSNNNNDDEDEEEEEEQGEEEDVKAGADNGSDGTGTGAGGGFSSFSVDASPSIHSAAAAMKAAAIAMATGTDRSPMTLQLPKGALSSPAGSSSPSRVTPRRIESHLRDPHGLSLQDPHKNDSRILRRFLVRGRKGARKPRFKSES